MFWIIIILGVITSIAVTLLILLVNGIKSITENLSEINKVSTNKEVMLSFPNNELEELGKEINKTLDQKKQIENKYKNTELELRQAIANMSHDLRTPLTSILGYIQLIKDTTLSENERNHYVDIVEKRAKSLKTLITSFYDLSRFEAKEYEFNFISVNLQNILCEHVASFYDDFTAKGIEPVIEIDENLPQIIADENAVCRIFNNLIQNVLRHGNKFVKIRLYNNNGVITTEFTNDAPNLSDEDIQHLFDRFFTADKMRSKQSTGLGLSITKVLVERMNGTISAKLKNSNLSIIITWKNL